jgi:hypothetical protein
MDGIISSQVLGCKHRRAGFMQSFLSGNLNFWLDGHYSDGITFKGDKDTPIVDELNHISMNLDRYNEVCVLIDDVRCFDPECPYVFTGYPTPAVLHFRRTPAADLKYLLQGLDLDTILRSCRSS